MKRIWMALTAGAAWTGLILQFVLMLKQQPDTGLALLNYFSYFTILTNILVALGLSISLAAPQTAAGHFFSRPGVVTAICLYIVMVGIVYNLLLRNTWNPQGSQLLADNLLHAVVPLLYFIYWIIYLPGKRLRQAEVFPWLVYPLAYLAFALIRGLSTGWYAYPFLNTGTLGTGRVMIYILVISLAFILMGLLLVLVNRRWQPVIKR